MNRRLMVSVASMMALLAVILVGIIFFQQPAKSASSVPGTDVLMAATDGANSDAVRVTPTLTPIPEDETQSALSTNLATPIP